MWAASSSVGEPPIPQHTGRVEHGTVDARPQVVVSAAVLPCDGHHAREAEAIPASHALLDRDLCRDLPLAAESSRRAPTSWLTPRRTTPEQPHFSTISGTASITDPRSPRLPSAVTIWIICDSRLPSIGLNTRSSDSPPTIMSTRLCRAMSSCARKYNGAAPCPSATRRQFVSFFGYANPFPSGPITSRNSCARALPSHSVPGPARIDDELEGAGPTTASRCLMHGEMSAQQELSSLRHLDRQELAGPGALGDLRGDERDGVVRAEPPRRRISARTRFIRPRPTTDAAASANESRDLRGAPARSLVVLLQRRRLAGTAAERLDASHRREDAGERRDARHARRRRRRTDEVAVASRTTPERSVDHEVHLPTPDELRHVVRSLRHLRHAFDRDAGALQHARGAARRDQAEPEVGQTLRREHDRALVAIGDARRTPCRSVGRPEPVDDQRLRERHARVAVDPHDLARRLHLGPEHRVDAREPPERQDRGLHGGVREVPVVMRIGRQHASAASSASDRPASTSVAILRQGHADRLRDERHRA